MDCPVCLEKVRDTMVSLPCGHLFCDNCIKDALRGELLIWRNCPICRQEVNNNGIHPCSRKVFMPECIGKDFSADNVHLRETITFLEARILQEQRHARQAEEAHNARRQDLEARVAVLERSLNDERRVHQALRLHSDRVRDENAAEMHTIRCNLNATLQQLRGKNAEASLLLSERDRKNRELNAYLQALRESNSRSDAASQECQALRDEVEASRASIYAQRSQIERLESELKAEKDIHNLRGNHLNKVLNDRRTPPPAQCLLTPYPTPPRSQATQLLAESHPVKIEPLDLTRLTSATTRPSPSIKPEPTAQEFFIQSRQGIVVDGRRGRVLKPVAPTYMKPDHKDYEEKVIKPSTSRSPSLPAPEPKVVTPAVLQLPSPAPSPQKTSSKRNAHVKWKGYGCPQFTDVPECPSKSGVHNFSGIGTNQYEKKFKCLACGWACSERQPRR